MTSVSETYEHFTMQVYILMHTAVQCLFIVYLKQQFAGFLEFGVQCQIMCCPITGTHDRICTCLAETTKKNWIKIIKLICLLSNIQIP